MDAARGAAADDALRHGPSRSVCPAITGSHRRSRSAPAPPTTPRSPGRRACMRSSWHDGARPSLGLAYVLTSCGDTLLDLGDDAGEALLAEAREVVDRCVDPGIAGRYLHAGQCAPPPLVRARRAHRRAGGATHRAGARRPAVPARPSCPNARSRPSCTCRSTPSRRHCSAIYRKLGVGDRKSAVHAAREFGIL